MDHYTSVKNRCPAATCTNLLNLRNTLRREKRQVPEESVRVVLLFFFFFLIFFLTIFAYLFIYFILFLFYGCVGSSFLCEGFLQLQQVGATLHRGARASHYRGLSCCGAQAPDAQAQ